MLGPALFSIFINDLFFVINVASLVTFADDNPIFTSQKTIKLTTSIWVDETMLAMDWFDLNSM